jgi:hypothetical protein
MRGSDEATACTSRSGVCSTGRYCRSEQRVWAITVAVRGQPLTAEAWVQSHTGLCVTCGEQWNWVGLRLDHVGFVVNKLELAQVCARPCGIYGK